MKKILGEGMNMNQKQHDEMDSIAALALFVWIIIVFAVLMKVDIMLGISMGVTNLVVNALLITRFKHQSL